MPSLREKLPGDNGRDHYQRFLAYEQYGDEIARRFRTLIDASNPQPVDFQDPHHHTLLTENEVGRLWGIFPETARNRAVPQIPRITSAGPIWFSPDSSPTKTHVTENINEAISPTAHGLGRTMYDLTESGFAQGASIEIREIPENGFSVTTRKLVQMGVAIHELAHYMAAIDLWGENPGRTLTYPTGEAIYTKQWMAEFAEIAEKYPPISRYSAAYRNEDGRFPRRGDNIIIGIPVSEELVDSITAHLMGFIVGPEGITFEPFKGREDMHDIIEAYLAGTVK